MKGRLKDKGKAQQNGFRLECAICIFVVEDEAAKDAITVLNGYAVCFDHLGNVRSNQFMQSISAARGLR